LFTPPLCEQVPRPEFELYEPLLQKLPADAGETAKSELAKAPISEAINNFLIMLNPFLAHREPLYL
jgi:hypothetical protein